MKGRQILVEIQTKGLIKKLKITKTGLTNNANFNGFWAATNLGIISAKYKIKKVKSIVKSILILNSNPKNLQI